MRQLRQNSIPGIAINTMAKSSVIYIDGASRGNPGPAAIGVVIRDEEKKVLAKISRAIGVTTNNQAEYRAVIAALEKASQLGINEVEMRSDSELIVRQIKGQYRVKNAGLKTLYQKVIQLQSRMTSFTITHIPREENQEADRLANEALR